MTHVNSIGPGESNQQLQSQHFGAEPHWRVGVGRVRMTGGAEGKRKNPNPMPLVASRALEELLSVEEVGFALGAGAVCSSCWCGPCLLTPAGSLAPSCASTPTQATLSARARPPGPESQVPARSCSASFPLICIFPSWRGYRFSQGGKAEDDVPLRDEKGL